MIYKLLNLFVLLLGVLIPTIAMAIDPVIEALNNSTLPIDYQSAHKNSLLPIAAVNPQNRRVDRLIIKFRHKSLIARFNITRLSSQFRKIRAYPRINNLHLYDVFAGNDIQALINDIAKDPNVEYVERDQRIHLRQLPNDTQYSQQWGLENLGAIGNIDVDINAEQAWDVTTGDQDVVVAVIDTGITYTHVDLVANMWRNPNEIANNNIDDDNNGYIDDIFGIDPGDGDSDPLDNSFNSHGTHVAGIIAANGNNGVGISGVNWDVNILACKVFSTRTNTGLSGFISSAIECIDYIIDLKLNQNINIVAVNNSWGWTGAYSHALQDAIQRLGDAGILFVAAAGNEGISNDVLIDYPSTYHLANIISVAATDSFGQATNFSNFGSRTVHVSAPGQEILSTLAGSNTTIVTVNPHINVLFDGAELGVARWDTEGSWGIANVSPYNGANVWSDSPGMRYLDNVNASLISNTLNLTVYGVSKLYLGFFAKFDLELGFDLLQVEFSADDGDTWTVAGYLTGFQPEYAYYEYEIPSSVKTASFQLRFHFSSDAKISGEGISIDDIGIGFGPAVRVDDRYGMLEGTSMAAPFITGSLALLKAQDPLRDWKQLKNLIIAGGQPFDQMLSPTISKRRLRLVDVNGVGSMSCNNQVVMSRLRPTFNNVDLLLGSNETLNIAYQHINCDIPAGELNVTLEQTSEVFALTDDGLGFDQVKADGIYSANIDILSRDLGPTGVANVRLPDGGVLRITGKKTYIADDNEVYNWRNLTTVNNIIFTDNDVTEFFSSPFPIPFDDDAVGFSEIGINENGFVVLAKNASGGNFVGLSYENNQIPTGSTTNMIAPFWDDLTGLSDRVFWGVTGVVPNRELVIQWSNIPRVAETKSGIKPSLQGVSFQLVLFESSSDVLFNYQDVSFGSINGDAGASATIGIQSSQMQGRTYSYNNPLLKNGSAIRWRTTSLINFPPLIAPIADKFIVSSQSVSFIIDVSDANGVRPILTVSGVPNGAVVDLATGQFDWINASTPGDYTVNFVATDAVDSALSAQLNVNIRVNENIAPVLTAPAEIDVVLGSDVSFTVSAIDQNGNPPILSVVTLPEGAQFDVARGRFQWTQPPHGRSRIEFLATDGLDASVSSKKIVEVVVSSDVPSESGKRGFGSMSLWIILLVCYSCVIGIKRKNKNRM